MYKNLFLMALIVFSFRVLSSEIYDLQGDYNPYLFVSGPHSLVKPGYAEKVNKLMSMCGKRFTSRSGNIVRCQNTYYDVDTGKEIDFIQLGNEFVKFKKKRSEEPSGSPYISNDQFLKTLLSKYYNLPETSVTSNAEDAKVRNAQLLELEKPQVRVGDITVEENIKLPFLEKSTSEKLGEVAKLCGKVGIASYSGGLATCHNGVQIDYATNDVHLIPIQTPLNTTSQSVQVIRADKDQTETGTDTSLAQAPQESGARVIEIVPPTLTYQLEKPKGPATRSMSISTDASSRESVVESNSISSSDGVQTGAIVPQPSIQGTPLGLNCQDELKKEALKLLKEDTTNLLGRQFQLTALKMAIKIQASKKDKRQTTIEDYIKVHQKELIKADNNELLNKMTEFYRKSGKQYDDQFIQSHFSKMKDASYWRKNSRLYNQEVSSFILADVYSNKQNSSFSEIDAAVTWLASEVSQIKDLKQGSVESNLMNISTLVHRQLDYLNKSTSALAVTQLENKKNNLQAGIDNEMKLIKTRLETFYNLCQVRNQSSPCWSQEIYNTSFIDAVLKVAQELKISDSQNYHLDLSKNGGFKINYVPPSP